MALEFDNLTDFSLHLASVTYAVAKVQHTALEKAAIIIEADAKNRIGEYQDAVGPFQAWSPLAESTEAEKARLGYQTDAPLLRTGDMRDSIQHEVEGNEAVIGSKSDIAAYQEFGTDKIPPRPFIGPAAFASKAKIENMLGHALVSGLFNGGKVIHESLGYDMEIGLGE